MPAFTVRLRANCNSVYRALYVNEQRTMPVTFTRFNRTMEKTVTIWLR